MNTRFPQIGVFSPYTLMLHCSSTGEKRSDFIKRALILFDNLLFIPRGLGDITARNAIITKEGFLARIDQDDPICSSKEFQKIL